MMNRRTLSLALACALSLSLLTACGGKGNDASTSGSGDLSGSVSGSVSSSADSSLPDGSAPDPSQPDGSAPDAAQPEQPPAETALTLNKTDFTLSKAGATYRLRAQTALSSTITFASSDEAVATVDAKGVVTAVAPGTAVITVTQGEATAQCTVRCSWKTAAELPAPQPAESAKPSAPSQDKLPAQSVSLSDFFKKIEKDYEMPFMEEVSGDTLSSFYDGLSDIKTEQCHVYVCGMNPSPAGDVALIQVSDSKDVDAVKAILQARINYMVGDGNGPGGAWYPEPTEMWENCSRIVTHGNYVMLVVSDSCDDIVSDFNAQF